MYIDFVFGYKLKKKKYFDSILVTYYIIFFSKNHLLNDYLSIRSANCVFDGVFL